MEAQSDPAGAPAPVGQDQFPVLPASPGSEPVPPGSPAPAGHCRSRRPRASPERKSLEAAARSGVNWFFWIAGLSVLNSAVFLMGGRISFVVGLGMTQFVDGFISAIANQAGGQAALTVRIIGFVLNLCITGIFVVAGILGRRMVRWAVIVGMVIYALDALLFASFGEWLSVGFHAFALWGLWNGLKAMNGLRELDAREPADELEPQPAPIQTPPPPRDVWQPPQG